MGSRPGTLLPVFEPDEAALEDDGVDEDDAAHAPDDIVVTPANTMDTPANARSARFKINPLMWAAW
jgi:hypothetical protein